jgi:hypothetical protein
MLGSRSIAFFLLLAVQNKPKQRSTSFPRIATAGLWRLVAQAEAYATKTTLNSIAGRVKRRMLRSLHNLSALPLPRGDGNLVHMLVTRGAYVSSVSLERAEKAIARGEAATIRSVILRLEVGVVYCRLAASSPDEPAAQRIRLRAQAALDSAVSAAEHLMLIGNDRAEFDAKAENLREALRETF